MSRTYGETRDCRGCRFWSEMIAISNGRGPVQAMCLSESGPNRAKYKTGVETCSSWASGHLGAVDEPGSDGTEYSEQARGGE